MATRLTQTLRIAALALGLAIAAAPALAELCSSCCCDSTPCSESAEPCAAIEAVPCCEMSQPASLPNTTPVSASPALVLGGALPVLPTPAAQRCPTRPRKPEAQAQPLRLSVVLRI